MKLDTFYRKAVAAGIARDPRGAEAVRKLLDEERERSKTFDGDERESWQEDRLFNPYADTRILAGDPSAEVRKVIAGIDMDAAEVMLAHTLNRDRGAGIDLVLAHHPQGVALAQLPEVMRVQADMLAAMGVTVSVAEQLLDKRMDEVGRRVLPGNHGRAVDAGLIIHEGQLTYGGQGLQKVVDLGAWWKQETGLPLPLGGNAVRRDLGGEMMARLTRLVRETVKHSLAHRPQALEYAMTFARGMDPGVADRFVGMWVNDMTVEMGERGRKAVQVFLDRGFEAGIVPRRVALDFVDA